MCVYLPSFRPKTQNPAPLFSSHFCIVTSPSYVLRYAQLLMLRVTFML